MNKFQSQMQAQIQANAEKRYWTAKVYIENGDTVEGACKKVGITSCSWRKRRCKIDPTFYPDTLSKKAQDNNYSNTDWRHGWIKDNGVSLFVKNPDNIVQEQDIEGAVSNALRAYTPKVKQPKLDKFDDFAYRVITSDKHVGMEVKGDSNVFNYQYNKNIYNQKMGELTEEVLSLKKGADKMFLVDLGDTLDGFSNQTTRGGHYLPQNLNSREQFDVYVENQIKYYLDIYTSGIAKEYEVMCICNDNHSGDYGWMGNKAIQKALEVIAPEIKFNIITDIFGYSEYGDHYFISTHGKDTKDMKGNWPLNLNLATENKIRDIIDSKNIRQAFIHVEKGDLHQLGYNNTGKFDYRNYMAFSPPSGWCQANFGSSYSGFSIQKVEKYGNLQHTDYFLSYI